MSIHRWFRTKKQASLVRIAAFCLVLLLLAVSPLSSQVSNETSTITIQVSDPTGAPIPNAHMRIVPYPRELSRKLETDSAGTVHVSLNPGRYEVFVRAAGFRASSRTFDVHLEGNEPIVLNLQVGSGSLVEPMGFRRSPDEEKVWQLEDTVWKAISGLDIAKYGALWDSKAVAWREVGYTIEGRENAVAWLKNYQAADLTLEEYSLGFPEIRARGSAAVVRYTVTSLWLDNFGRGKSKNERVEHTWVEIDGQWRILAESVVSLNR